MAISKEIRIDLDVLERVVAEGDSDKVSVYVNTETGAVLLAKDLLEEEIQNRQRFLKFPSEQLLSIACWSIKKWIEDILEMINQTHSEDFTLRSKTQLEQAMKQINRVHSVTIALIDLQGKGLADNFYDSWLEFVDREQVGNIRNWLSSKGIHLED
jgi:hypothetical protein